MLLSMTGHLRQFVPDCSTVTAPISDILKYPRFRTKRAREKSVPWVEQQTKAFHALIEALASQPVLALQVWTEQFLLYTDASGVGAGGVLLQSNDGLEKVNVRQQNVVERGLLAGKNRS